MPAYPASRNPRIGRLSRRSRSHPNTSVTGGGAIALSTNARADIDNSVFTNNTSTGTVSGDGGSTFRLDNGAITTCGTCCEVYDTSADPVMLSTDGSSWTSTSNALNTTPPGAFSIGFGGLDNFSCDASSNECTASGNTCTVPPN